MNKLFKVLKIVIYIELAVLYILGYYGFLIYGVPIVSGKNTDFFHYFVGFMGCLIIPSIIIGIRFRIKPQPYKLHRFDSHSDYHTNPAYSHLSGNIFHIQ